jgi:two-component system sensor histidine kinase MprB
VLSAIAIAILATAAYLAAATDLRSAVDDKLVGRVEFVRNASAAELPPFDDTEADTVTSSESTEPTIPPDLLGDEGLEVFTPSGDRFLSQIDGLAFAPDLSTEELAVIDGDATGPVTRSMRRDDDYVRTSMGAITGGGTVRFSKDTSDIEAGLSALRTRMALGAVGAGLLVAVAAWWFAGRFVAPVTVVAEAAEELARTQDLPSRLDESRNDEVGRLASSFNSLVEALALAREQQRRLVADASHELRTPLTSVRTKIEFLQTAPELSAERREAVVDAAVVDLTNLTGLVTELVDLATEVGSSEEEAIELDFALLIDAECQRFSNATGRRVNVATDSEVIIGRPQALSRAVSNLLRNADKFSPEGESVEVVQSRGSVVVRDHGPGIAASDRERVFDRFYRSPLAADTEGSGIGLAIVSKVAETHGGQVWVDSGVGAGAEVGFSVATQSDRVD